MIEKLNVKYHDHRVGTISLTPDGRLCVFEYDAKWLTEGFSISPLKLPLKSGTFIAPAVPFSGNFGIFEDSLPDGYGRYLLHKALAKEGVNDRSLSSLDRLSIVGADGMGALTYEPAKRIQPEADVTDFDILQEKALEVLAEQQDTDAEMLLYNSGNSGGARPKVIFSDDEGHWLVKFRHTYDPHDIGMQEFRYNEAARRSGIEVPDYKLIDGKYFATRRFDIAENGERVHTATVGALLDISLRDLVLDYSNLLALTGYLTQNPADVEEMYRRMIFNYLTDNKDDHCKNFSFLMRDIGFGQREWRLAPAYDLTLCSEGYNGEHATTVNGKGKPGLTDFITIGRQINMTDQRCRELINQVAEGCRDITRYEIR